MEALRKTLLDLVLRLLVVLVGCAIVLWGIRNWQRSAGPIPHGQTPTASGTPTSPHR